MTIETKYNIGDEVWIYKDYKKGIIQGQVQDLRATSVFLDPTPTIEYTIRCVNNRGNLKLFHRLEEDVSPPKKNYLKVCDMKILMNEDIDIGGATYTPIAIVPEDNEQLHKVLSKHLSKAQADAIINEGAWFSKDGCESYYVKSIDDWSI